MIKHSRASTKGLVEAMFRNTNMVFTPTPMKLGNFRHATKRAFDRADDRVSDDYLKLLMCELNCVALDIRTQFPLSQEVPIIKTATKRRGNGHGF
jgi:hypothetical protein